ncbi:MAG: formamidopyrimidine-DNA glycosidase [Candidatus Berkelbacteria bacterium Athens1014_28]|uniref:Formamidopyrimidine-DNA glycosidase n=1 Tax=Candidatus Berkelbacteria bacterium Athens1014_28 TaxID=2017145 RepID=A0A554LMC9_9BACT|nr:MAG: formamidopyrimidine-DNA glycosidase [Candidatus Berkelbacteria bacterium Athens1014_28]
MPELPEVETIRRGLQKAIIGKTIVAVEIRVPKMFHGNKSKIIGKKVKNIERRAKQIIIDLEGKNDLLIHLKMTGQLIYREKVEMRDEKEEVRIKNQIAGGHPSKDWFDNLPNATTHIIFDFSDGSKLFFNDLRKFGWIKVFNANELASLLADSLGVEPFDKEFTAKKLAEIIAKKPRWNIKKILTDQSLISGIGNIYADESLFYAGILPTRLGSMIKYDEVLRLHTSIIKALNIGLKYGGSSENTYVQIDGSRGKAQEHFQVYSRGGKKCSCGGVVKKIRLNSRGTHFCEKCQK